MTARAAKQTISTLLALASSLMLAFAFSTAAVAQEEPTDDDTTQEDDGGALDGLDDDGQGDEGADDGTGDGTDDGFDDGSAEGFEQDTDDGFDEGTDAGATGDDGFDDGAQVDAPAGGVEAGFGGLAGDGDPVVSGFFVGSLAVIAAVAGLTWWRRVGEAA